MVSIKGLDKAELLSALVNQGRPLGMGVLHNKHLTIQEAQTWIDEKRSHDMGIQSDRLYFDYVCGVPVKSDLSGDEVNPALYDRDQGLGAFARVVKSLTK